MLAKVLTCAVVGLDGVPIEIEANLGMGLPAFNVLGLPDAAVQESRERQRSRFKAKKIHANAEMGPAEVRDFCRTDTAAQNLLRVAMQQLRLSARGYHRVLKLSRTIADLAGADTICAAQVAESVQYRPRERVSGAYAGWARPIRRK